MLQNLEFKGPNPLRVGLRSLDDKGIGGPEVTESGLKVCFATQKSMLKRETNVVRKKSCF